MNRIVHKWRIQKKYALYFIAVLVEFLLLIILSQVLCISTSNTWLGVMGIDVIYITITIALVNYAKQIRHSKPFLFFLISFITFLLILFI